MKKQLLSIFAALTVGTVLAQVPSPDWSTNQNAVFPTALPNAGVDLMDAVDANVVWVTGIDYAAPNRNYNWYSRSTNGGALFAGGNIYSDTNTYVLANMEGIDANTAWVCSFMKGVQGMGAIHRTTNGGTNWVNMTAAGMFTHTTESFANFVTFLTPSLGIANGDPVNGSYEIWRTTDGGQSWTPTPPANIPLPLPGEFAIVNLYAKVGSSNLWFGTNGNRMFRTTDGGITYSVAPVGAVSSNTIVEIAFSSPLEGICVMIDAAFNAQLWNTYDGGATWAQINPIPASFGLDDIGNIPGTGNLVSYGSAAGNEVISYSSDNGLSWTDWGSTGIPYVTGDFVDGNTGWAGSFSFQTFTEVWKYTGSGVTGTMSPVASFTLPSTVCLGGGSANVTPANTSLGSPGVSYNWNVSGAGTISNATASAPTITFPGVGSYSVTLTASNTIGSNTAVWVVDVVNCVAPTANFSVPLNGCTNFSFTATNTSAGTPNPTSFWSISPATNVTLSPSAIANNASFRVANAGTYTISLVTSNATGTALSTQVVTVAACPPEPSFSLFYYCLPLPGGPITFSTVNQSQNPAGTSGPMSYTWSILPTGSAVVTPNYVSLNMKVTVPQAVADAMTTYTISLKAKNASGTSTTYTQVVTPEMYFCNAVGIKENSFLAQNLSVYPNPAHDQLSVALPSSIGACKVKLTNILGAVVFEETMNTKIKENNVINLSGKSRGVYFLTIESNNEKVTKKIVVE